MTEETREVPQNSRGICNDVVFAKGARVALRPLCEADAPMLMQWVNDPDTRKFMGMKPISLESEVEWIRRQEGEDNRFVFVLVAQDRPIGTMSLGDIDWISRTAETGAMIGEKDCRGKGYGSEAKMLLLDFAFNDLGLRKVRSRVLGYNERSLRYSLKCGYEEEGRLEKETFKNGEFFDMILLAVFRDRWMPLWEQFKKNGFRLVG